MNGRKVIGLAAGIALTIPIAAWAQPPQSVYDSDGNFVGPLASSDSIPQGASSSGCAVTTAQFAGLRTMTASTRSIY
jgi:hypothetical protein